MWFRAHTSSLCSSHSAGSGIALFAVRFAPLLPSFFLVFFFSLSLAVLSRPSLNFSFLPSSLSRACANARNFTETSLVSIPVPTRYSLGDTVFLDISMRHNDDGDGKMRCRFSPCHVLARDDRTLSPRIYAAKHDSRELSTMKFANGTIPFRFIHFSYRHHKQYILQNFASFPTYI